MFFYLTVLYYTRRLNCSDDIFYCLGTNWIQWSSHHFCGISIVRFVWLNSISDRQSDSILISDVGMLTLNQYILLDPILLCFMTASVLGMVKLSKATHCGDNFSRKWWYWLFFTGTMLACTISVKFVGLFVVLLVGLHTINDLWIVLGDLAKPVVSHRFHFIQWHHVDLLSLS